MVKKVIIPVILAFLFTAIPLHAEPKVQCEVKKIRQHNLLVTFSWNVTVQSDKTHDACDLTISFRDAKNREVYLVSETLRLKSGKNTFEGHEICEVSIWESVVKYLATLDCVF